MYIQSKLLDLKERHHTSKWVSYSSPNARNEFRVFGRHRLPSCVACQLRAQLRFGPGCAISTLRHWSQASSSTILGKKREDMSPTSSGDDQQGFAIRIYNGSARCPQTPETTPTCRARFCARACICMRAFVNSFGGQLPHTPASPTSPSKSAPGGKGYVHLSIRHLLFILRPHSRYPSLTIVVVVRVLKSNKTTLAVILNCQQS